jgi:hypothetical protein
MKRPIRSIILPALAGAMSLTVLTAAPAAAQDQPAAPQLQPPTPTKPDKPPSVMNYLTMIIIIAAVVGANMIPSKRGHQD